jgi:hypothetical protein
VLSIAGQSIGSLPSVGSGTAAVTDVVVGLAVGLVFEPVVELVEGMTEL